MNFDQIRAKLADLRSQVSQLKVLEEETERLEGHKKTVEEMSRHTEEVLDRDEEKEAFTTAEKARRRKEEMARKILERPIPGGLSREEARNVYSGKKPIRTPSPPKTSLRSDFEHTYNIEAQDSALRSFEKRRFQEYRDREESSSDDEVVFEEPQDFEKDL
ncbi:hypothetical protein CDL15_Pgr004990 [Punica granatum]|uniref:Uncharacterized protein n=1 Tax=Punica granatum TaxID=22663 RepID=A0A218WWB6_PUNGR|nr:hypothetical protein CDL15_Pgr004990 [Punica granatum]